jgi:8-oxo-dGTP diphosphatase
VKKQGTSIALINSRSEVLLYLRDHNPGISYPGRWDLLGGHVEPDETPDECIAREIHEEIGYELKSPELFKIFDLEDRIEWMYWERAEIDVATSILTEGERLDWFSANRIRRTPSDQFAFDFKCLLLDFFDAEPFL